MLSGGLSLIDLLARHSDGQGVSSISRAVNLPVSSTHRLLAILVAEEWVAQDPLTSLYRVGPKALPPARAYQDALRIGDTRAVLEELSRSTGETAILGTIVNHEVMHLDSVNGGGLLRVHAAVGSRSPLYCTALGKVLFGSLSAEEQDWLLPELSFARRTPKTITSREGFLDEVRLAAERGYAVADQENEVGVTSFAVPVNLGQDEDGHYAICLAVPTGRITPELQQTVIEQLTMSQAILNDRHLSA